MPPMLIRPSGHIAMEPIAMQLFGAGALNVCARAVEPSIAAASAAAPT